MKKFVVFALGAMFLVSCSCTPTEKGKCKDLKELQNAVLTHSTDTARYDLNGDGEINIADINVLIASMPTDSTTVNNETDSI